MRKPRQRCAGAAVSLRLTASADLSSQSGLLAREFRTYLDHAKENLVDQAGDGAAKRAVRAD